jgi:hypothetical protein
MRKVRCAVVVGTLLLALTFAVAPAQAQNLFVAN